MGTITLNRPARRNALNGELIGALDAAVRHMADDPEVKVVVLTGAAPEGGTGGFCSGGDVKDGARGPGGEKGVPVDALSGDLSRHDLHAAMLLHVMPKPTIAMVGGPAVGAGCSLAAACDLRFAVRGCRVLGELLAQRPVGRLRGFLLLDPHRRDGVGPAPLPLEREDHRAQGMELGMVHAVLPPAELNAYTYEVAETLVRTPATLLALVKDNLNAAEDEVERRRWLFAHEAENQLTSAKAFSRRADGAPRTRRQPESARPAGAARAPGSGAAAEWKRPGRRGQWPAPDGDRGGNGAEDPGGDDPSLVHLHPGTLVPKCWREARRT